MPKLPSSIPYSRLSVEVGGEHEELHDEPKREYPSSRPSPGSRRVLLVVMFFETLVLTYLIFRPDAKPKYSWPSLVYSPAQDAVEYGVTTYAIGGDPKFHIPPSPQLDANWDDLYNFGISQISKSEARLLPNKTHPIPGDENNYIAELDVFHNLHCLNMIRKGLHKDYYQEQAMELDHLDHCIDWIRQALMCASDTSVIVWQWDPKQQKTTFQGDVAHTCRNFELVRQWGKEHMIRRKYDTSVRIEDDIVVESIPMDFFLG
ncbi:hypothetical protein MKEN_00537600 [Mycena kentingensis (nom. inval.)]|nr:hypothetical protein MKEN_00537600 [Mycena kentingensis (nom. inval.)]